MSTGAISFWAAVALTLLGLVIGNQLEKHREKRHKKQLKAVHEEVGAIERKTGCRVPNHIVCSAVEERADRRQLFPGGSVNSRVHDCLRELERARWLVSEVLRDEAGKELLVWGVNPDRKSAAR